MIVFTHKRDEDWKSSTMWGKHAIAEQGDPPGTSATEALSVLALQNAPIKTSHTYSSQVVILPLKIYVVISPTNSNIHMCTKLHTSGAFVLWNIGNLLTIKAQDTGQINWC